MIIFMTLDDIPKRTRDYFDRRVWIRMCSGGCVRSEDL